MIEKRFKNELGHDIFITVDREQTDKYNGFVITIDNVSSSS